MTAMKKNVQENHSCRDLLSGFIDRAISKGVEFAVCALPGENDFHCFLPGAKGCDSHAGSHSKPVFEIGKWLAPYDKRIVISNEMSLRDAVRSLEKLPDSPALQGSPVNYGGESVCSTSHEVYIRNLSRVIESCKARDGKTVFSRLISGESTAGAQELFAGLCDRFPETFRFIFFSSETGLWIGASPEILLSADFSNGTFETMALAGTRRKSSAPWDAKNLRENRFVSDYIMECAGSLHIPAEMTELQTVEYGEIEHLCRRIKGSLTAGQFKELFDRLNPTPALCGTPRDAAIADIARYEPHSRDCYGGFVALHTPDCFYAFATLRCCRLDGRRMQIYAGGGITPDSDPETEWDETESKSTFFRNFLFVPESQQNENEEPTEMLCNQYFKS